jgi:hydrogenase/urease accessory protein HupE
MSRTHAIPGWATVVAVGLLSLVFWFAGPRPVVAHEILPTIADFAVTESRLELVLQLDIEAMIAGLDLSAGPSATDPPQMPAYTALRALPASAIADRFSTFWPSMANRITVQVDGASVKPTVRSLTPPEKELVGLARTFTLALVFDLPTGSQAVEIGWDQAFGPLVLRQNGVVDPYDGYLEPGTVSPQISLSGGASASGWQTFLQYVPVGFDHIVPKGLDHILFVLGLFLFSPRLRPLLMQVSAFTLAHTVTLAAAATSIITVPAYIVEPAIAASIIYIAVENIFAKRLNPLRLPLVFVFGLLHGLGFASVLQEFGLPDESFVPALLGFNLGVEIGQLAVIGAAFLLVGVWFRRHRFYRALVTIPGSAIIGVAGAVWLLQRVA